MADQTKYIWKFYVVGRETRKYISEVCRTEKEMNDTMGRTIGSCIGFADLIGFWTRHRKFECMQVLESGEEVLYISYTDEDYEIELMGENEKVNKILERHGLSS